LTTAIKSKRPIRAVRQGDPVVVLVWEKRWTEGNVDTAKVRRRRTVEGDYCVEERTDTYGEPLVRYLAFRRVRIGPRGPEYALVGGEIEAKRRRRRGDRLVYRREYLKRLLRQAMHACEEDANVRNRDG